MRPNQLIRPHSAVPELGRSAWSGFPKPRLLFWVLSLRNPVADAPTLSYREPCCVKPANTLNWCTPKAREKSNVFSLIQITFWLVLTAPLPPTSQPSYTDCGVYVSVLLNDASIPHIVRNVRPSISWMSANTFPNVRNTL